MTFCKGDLLPNDRFWNGHGQDSKSILQHSDQHVNTKLIKMKDHNLKHTNIPSHMTSCEFQRAFYQICS